MINVFSKVIIVLSAFIILVDAIFVPTYVSEWNMYRVHPVFLNG